MAVILLANVGNSDLEVQEGVLPGEGAPWSVRRRAEYVLEHIKEIAPSIHLPLISPTLRWLYDRHQIADGDFSIVLFASDQLEDVTPERDRQKDTKPVADVIQHFLTMPEAVNDVGARNFRSLSKKKVQIRAIEGNPADYSNMLAFYSSALPELAKRMQPTDTVYLEVSGGTPAMTSMLILVAVEVFGVQAHTLYLDRGASQPYEVSVASELYARRTRDTLLTQVDLNAYAVARHTLATNGTIVHIDEARRSLIAALLEYADRRLAFDFDQARSALTRARQLTTGNDQAYVKSWMTQLETPDIAVNLAELLHSMKIKHRFGDYADFVQRIFRFQEAAFRYMAEQMGMRYRDANRDEYVHVDWVRGVPELANFLENYRHPVTGNRMPVEYAGVSLNRVSLGAIVDFFVGREDSRRHWQETAKDLHSLSRVAELRNRGLSGHGFRGISSANVEEAYGAGVDQMLERLDLIYTTLFGGKPGESPYEAVNHLLRRLISPTTPRIS